MNSSSKYINGHSNSISGIITDSGRFKWDVEKYPGMADFKVWTICLYCQASEWTVPQLQEPVLSPQNAFYNCIGLETLGIRMERICDNAAELARFL